jgi:N-acetylneuraminate synthase
VLTEEQPTIDFAYASVVTLGPLAAGTILDRTNTWVKRPGTGEIPAADLDRVLGSRALRDLPAHHQLRWDDVERRGDVER